MNIAIVGTGYVGLVSGACFAEMGIDVTCVDIDNAKIEKLLNGEIPIYEPGLEDLVARNVRQGRLHFTTSLSSVIDNCDIVFSAVGTPPDEDGSADLQYVLAVAREFGQNIKKYTVLVTKSTVPVGTAQKVKQAVEEELRKRGEDIAFDVASNPEFLKEGAAIQDFMNPDRVVVGVDTDRARKVMTRLYRPIMLNHFRVIFTDIRSAELVGADADMVRKGIGADTRIGRKFLYPGCGYGGSCFPKDVKALIKTAEQNGYPMRVLRAVEEVNESQKRLVFDKLVKALGGELKGKRIAVWGLAFKPETDDMREAPSLVVIQLLLEAGCTVRVFDPIAMDECKRRIGDVVEYAKDMYDATLDADAMLMLTEWKQFRIPSWGVLQKSMRNALIIDGRNIYDPQEMEENGFEYHCIGR